MTRPGCDSQSGRARRSPPRLLRRPDVPGHACAGQCLLSPRVKALTNSVFPVPVLPTSVAKRSVRSDDRRLRIRSSSTSNFAVSRMCLTIAATSSPSGGGDAGGGFESSPSASSSASSASDGVSGGGSCGVKSAGSQSSLLKKSESPSSSCTTNSRSNSSSLRFNSARRPFWRSSIVRSSSKLFSRQHPRYEVDVRDPPSCVYVVGEYHVIARLEVPLIVLTGASNVQLVLLGKRSSVLEPGLYGPKWPVLGWPGRDEEGLRTAAWSLAGP